MNHRLIHLAVTTVVAGSLLTARAVGAEQADGEPSEFVSVALTSDDSAVVTSDPKVRSVSGLLIEATQPFTDLPEAWQVERFARRMRLERIAEPSKPGSLKQDLPGGPIVIYIPILR